MTATAMMRWPRWSEGGNGFAGSIFVRRDLIASRIEFAQQVMEFPEVSFAGWAAVVQHWDGFDWVVVPLHADVWEHDPQEAERYAVFEVTAGEATTACCGMCWETVAVAAFVTTSDRLEYFREMSDFGQPQGIVRLDGARFNDDEFPPIGLKVVTAEGCVRTVSGGCCGPDGIHGWKDEHGERWATTAIVGLPPAARDARGALDADAPREFGEKLT